MPTNTVSQSVHRRGATRRTFAAGVALFATVSAMSWSGPRVGAKSKTKQRKAKHQQPAHQQAKQATPEAVEAEKHGGKVVTRTFSSPNAIVINDKQPADPYPSTIQVSGFKKGKITDVNVYLRGLNHGQPENIDVVLVGPTGAGTYLMADAGGSADALSFTLKIDDEAGLTLPDNSALSTGSFRPANHPGADAFPSLSPVPTATSLSVFDGSNPNGEWRLYVVDDSAPNTGAFSGGWDLELSVKLAKKKKHGRKH